MKTSKKVTGMATMVMCRKQREDKTIMNTGFERSIALLGIMFAACLIVLPALGQDMADNEQATPAVSEIQEADAASVAEPANDAAEVDAAQTDSAGAISEAEEYLRRGVDLYKRDLYREALTEFNRALALDPALEEARQFQEKANARLQQAMVGMEVESVPSFQTIDPSVIRENEGAMELTAEEIRRERIQELLSYGIRYLEAGKYDTAVEIYSNALLIDPENAEAKEGLHKATLGSHTRVVDEAEVGVTEDRAMIRSFIEESKRLPEGADARGIKPYRFAVPEIEEEYAAVKEKTPIEAILESPCKY